MDSEQRITIQFLDRESELPESIVRRHEFEFPKPPAPGEHFHDEVSFSESPVDSLGLQILLCPDKQPFNFTYSLAEALNGSYSIPPIVNYLDDSLGMKISPRSNISVSHSN
jgi:hypothetical protein